MLFVGKGTKRKFTYTKSLIPDAKSLKMKILRANLVSHGWVNCQNPSYEGLDPLKYGWKIENYILRPVWFDGAPLPSKKELNENLEGRIDLMNLRPNTLKMMGLMVNQFAFLEMKWILNGKITKSLFHYKVSFLTTVKMKAIVVLWLLINYL